MIKFITGGGVLACGALILITSADMSYQGYELAFETINGAGQIGWAVAGLAFFSSAAASVAVKQGAKRLAAIACLMALSFGLADIYGNNLATRGDVDTEATSAADAQAAFDAAMTALPTLTGRIANAQNELDIVTSDDVCKAQRLLQAKGLYPGKIDCIYGGLTQSAMMAFGTNTRAMITDLAERETALQTIVSAGRPNAPRSSKAFEALCIAIGLTLASTFAALLGGGILAGGATRDEIEALEEEIGDFEAEVVSLAQYLEAA